jgi:hypothetical protein
MKTNIASILAVGCLTALLGGCKSASEPPAQTVRQACEIRTTWEHRIRTDCTRCLAMAAAPSCGECTLHEQVGRCSDPQKAKVAEPACKETDKCVRACERTDCECIDRCYAENERCERLAAAVDACTTHACDAYCR